MHIAAEVGVERQTLWYWRRERPFQAEVQELRLRLDEEVYGHSLANKRERVIRLVAHATADRGLPDSGPQRLIGDPKIPGKNPQGLVATADELHRFGLECRRVDRAGVGHGNTSSRAPNAQ
jgi:hypothetical protein